MSDPTEGAPVTWETHYTSADPAEIARVEASWHIQFPEDFRSIALLYHGGCPSADIVSLPGRGWTRFSTLLSFGRSARDHIARVWGDLFPYLPTGVFPFGGDVRGCYFAFDYRIDPNCPGILYLNHNTLDADGFFESVLLADTFTESVAGLRVHGSDLPS